MKKELPDVIHVKIKRGKSGRFIIYLPDFDTTSEADCREDIDFIINDLIYTIFDIPKNLQGKIWYKPAKRTSLVEVDVKQPFLLLMSPKVFQTLHSN